MEGGAPLLRSGWPPYRGRPEDRARAKRRPLASLGVAALQTARQPEG